MYMYDTVRIKQKGIDGEERTGQQQDVEVALVERLDQLVRATERLGERELHLVVEVAAVALEARVLLLVEYDQDVARLDARRLVPCAHAQAHAIALMHPY